ncbi:pentachlorophenol monooxygenase, partial [Streptomyces sp. NPDC047939]
VVGAPYGPADAPQPGDRAPDCGGLTTSVATYPLRLLDVLRGRTGHVLILYADSSAALAEAAEPVAEAGPETVGVLASGSAVSEAVPCYQDTGGEFARLYRPDGPTGFLVRPDGQLGARFPLSDTARAVPDYLAALSGPAR